MTAERRVRLRPDQRRAQLIELGVQMLATRPLDQLSVEEIAAAAGISRGLLFHYFASKREFHLAVAGAAADELIRRTAPGPDVAPAQALRQSLGAFVDYVEENPDNYRSLVRGTASADVELRAVSDRTRAALARRTLDVLGQLGVAGTPALELTVHGWLAYVEECACRWLEDRELGRDALLAQLGAALPALLMATGELDGPVLAAALGA